MVNLNMIGENSEGLICLTANDILNYRNSSKWILPNGTKVSEPNGREQLLVFNRPHALFLSRGYGVELPTGVYTCEIPDINLDIRTLHVLGYKSELVPGIIIN